MHHDHRSLSWNLVAPEDSDLTVVLPELIALRQVIEQSDWHHDDAFQQSLRLFRWVKRLPASLQETVDTPEAIVRALLTAVVDSEHGHYTALELMAFVALIHDVGKTETFQRLPDGTTRCPGHEAVGARMTPTICARFDFTLAETRFITDLVGAHDEPYALFKKVGSLPTPQQQERMARFETERTDCLLPLLLLAWGDLVTSHLNTIRPEKYEAVFNFYRRRLQGVWTKKNQRDTKA